jgi:hypothetical protein
MPYNGSGTFTLPAGNPVVTGTTISSVTTNNTNNDIANGLSNAVTRNGQSPPTANLPMGGFHLTGLGAGTAAGDSVRFEQTTLKTSLTGSSTLPVGTLAERDGTPNAGYVRFNTTYATFEGYNGTAWGSIGGGATGGGSDQVFIENSQTVTTDYTLTTGKNAMSTGPITINSGVTITVPSTQRWIVL